MPKHDPIRIVDLLSFPQAAVIAGVSRQRVYQWTDPRFGRTGKNGIKILLRVLTVAGGYQVICRHDLEQFLADVAVRPRGHAAKGKV